MKQKLHTLRETKLTQAVNQRSGLLSQLQVKNVALSNEVEELKGQLLLKCNESSDASIIHREEILKIQLNIQQLNGRIRNEKIKTLLTNNALEHEKYKTKTMLDSIPQLRAKTLSLQKKVDVCGREKQIFNLEAQDMRNTMKTYEDTIAQVQQENDLLRNNIVNLQSQTESRECEWQLSEKKLEKKIKRLEGIAKLVLKLLL